MPQFKILVACTATVAWHTEQTVEAESVADALAQVYQTAKAIERMDDMTAATAAVTATSWDATTPQDVHLIEIKFDATALDTHGRTVDVDPAAIKAHALDPWATQH